MRKISLFIIILLGTLLLTGCESTSSNTTGNKTVNEVVSNGKTVNTKKMGQLHCTRAATAGSGIEVSLEYDVFYTGENINIVHSMEKIITADNNTLDTYENAYRGIHDHYKGLDYYDANVIRGDTTVTSDIVINFDKIDIDKLIEIEGEEDNIFENKVPKLEKWLALGKKIGVKCEESEEE